MLLSSKVTGPLSVRNWNKMVLTLRLLDVIVL